MYASLLKVDHSTTNLEVGRRNPANEKLTVMRIERGATTATSTENKINCQHRTTKNRKLQAIQSALILPTKDPVKFMKTNSFTFTYYIKNMSGSSTNSVMHMKKQSERTVFAEVSVQRMKTVLEIM